MIKKEILSGAFIVLIIGAYFRLLFPYPVAGDLDKVPMFNINEFWANIFTWYGTIASILIVVLGIVDYAKKKPKISPESDLKIAIPIYFLIPLLPILFGSYIIMIGRSFWGIVLACTGFPALLIFVLIALRKIAKESKSKSNDDLP